MAKTTFQSLTKVPGILGLYRHDNGSFYGRKKVGGNKKTYALVTADGQNITEREAAKKALAAWFLSLEAPAPKPNELTVSKLWEKFLAQKAGQAPKTLEKYGWVKQCIDVDFPSLWSMRVDAVKPSHLAEFFAKRRSMKAGAFNEMTMHVKNLFAVAVADEIVSSNPYAKVQKEVARKKNVRKPDEVPSIEQCEKIVADIRGQEFAETAEASADMVALMHLAALGQAELIPLDWKDVHRTGDDKKLVIWERKKTGEYFEVPLYPALTAFIDDLWQRQDKPTEGKVISILSPKQAIYNSCTRLKLPQYSPRDFRKARIVWFLRKGIPVELIAKWQGHKDNGVLIRRTYANVISEADKPFEKAQLAKLALAKSSRRSRQRPKRG